MSYLKKLRILLAGFLLKLKLKKRKRTPVTCNLSAAKSIGLLFNSDNESDRKTAKALESFFKQSEVRIEVLGYSKFKHNTGNLIGDNQHHYIHPQDFNFFYHPKNNAVDSFIQRNFDILINLYQDAEFPVEYITKMSEAKFKVGCAHLDPSMHDLMIDVNNNKGDSAYLCKHLKYYLSIIS
ncbi:hypothetical protein SAMN06265379_101239 [Saccharicrinis carchari]|uniref:Uncharacterized protein n=1 Tax=Saccharicrinis carchari TaxID=1168039 RepID=A0A521ALW6_SACCC|nr:hypothetical protein [Saccharicrinis carchari]SMO35771.1 hypothetical protein SAMN06265379_101239 [Saccharicrinis carchari]